MMVSFVLGIFSTKIVSLFLGTPGMALIGSFRNFSSMLKSTTTLGINNSLIKLFIENKDDKAALSSIYSTFFWFFLIVSSLLGLLVLFFAGPISSFLFFTNSYTIPIQFFGLLLPLMVINTFWIAIYNGLEQFKKMIAIQIIANVLIFGSTAFLIWKQHIFGGLLSVAIGEFLMVVVTFLYVLKDKHHFQFELKNNINKEYLKVIKQFSAMALLSAVIAPLTLMLIRNIIVKDHSIQEAGLWDGVSKLSSFYMMIFSSGLSLYYMPKLASLQTDAEFKTELRMYFKLFVPLFLLMLLAVFVCKGLILDIAFTPEFAKIKEVLIWQLSGDFIKIMTLAFGYQIVVKTRIKDYIILETGFNFSYLVMAFYFIKGHSFEGALQAYFYANLLLFIIILWMFRGVLLKKDNQLE